MGWLSDVANNGINVSAAQDWVNQKKEEEWAAAKEEERRRDRVHENEGISYDPAPAIEAAKDRFKKTAEHLRDVVTGETTGGEAGVNTYEPQEPAGESGQGEAGNEPQQPAPVEPAEPVQPQVQTPESETEAETEAETRSSGERRADAQAPIVYTGGGTTTPAGTGSKGTGASGTKAALSEEEEDVQGLPAAFWDWTAEEQQEYLANPRNQRTAREQTNRQARENLSANDIMNNMPKLGNGNFSFNPPAPGTQPAVTPQPSGETAAQRAAAYQAAWQRRNADIQQRLAMQNYQYDPLQAAILRANAGLGGSGMETRGYDPGLRLANDQQYLADNGFSWAGNPSLQSADRGTTEPTYMNNPQYQTDLSLGLIDDSFTPETLEKMYGTGPEIKEWTPAEQPDVYSQAYQSVIENGGSDRDAEIAATQAAAASDIGDPVGDWFRNTQEKDNAYQEAYGQAYADAITNGYSEREAEAIAMKAGRQASENTAYRQTPAEEMRHRPGYSYVPNVPAPQTPAATTAATPTTGGQSTGNGRPGAEAALEGIMETTDRGPNNKPDSVLFAEQAAAKRNGSTGTGSGNNGKAGSGTGTGTGNKGTGSSSGSDVPEKSQYFRPSYGQDMEKGVKAPYRKGGYTIEELEKMGNAPRPNKKYPDGKPVYEGYYKAPDGAYYPIDQDKARYYLQYGTYKGWEEGMRDYWNNFGTFYGYRPDWKTAGGKNVWKQNSGRSSGGGRGGYSYSGGGSGGGSGRSYGGGSTANNGLYWNPNTSWSI